MKQNCKCRDGKSLSPIYKEYGLLGDERQLDFSNFGMTSRKLIAPSLSRYSYAYNYWKNYLDKALARPANWTRSRKSPITKAFLNGNFYHDKLGRFNSRFEEWLKELAHNERSFKPFNLDSTMLNTFVNGYEQLKRNFLGRSVPDEWDYRNFDAILDKIERSIPQMEPEKKFMALFSEATKEIVEEKLTILTELR